MRQRSEEQLETPITPMIDVTFQLIIFFVVAAAQQKDIIDENVTLAQASYVAPVQKNEPRAVTINVRQNGKVNVVLLPLTAQQLYQILVATRRESGSSVPIILRCDAQVLYHDIDRVLKVIEQAGLYRVRIAAVVKKP